MKSSPGANNKNSAIKEGMSVVQFKAGNQTEFGFSFFQFGLIVK